MDSEKRKLELLINGRIIDHLGLKMYQSPVAAIAEIIANSYDADATEVKIYFQDHLEKDSEIIVCDNGNGMTFSECQNNYLSVGFNRRERGEISPLYHRKVIGRKGIGKFAGFGISEQIQIETTSTENGENTIFVMDVNKIRNSLEENKEIELINYSPPSEEKRTKHGTKLTLKSLLIKRPLPEESFIRSISRRFTLLGRAQNFQLFVNDKEVSPCEDFNNFQLDFPKDYTDDEKPKKLEITEDSWGIEELPSGNKIKWRIGFYEDPIKEEYLRGVSVFVRKKIAQVPFFFNLEGGLGGQLGQSYLTGQIEADYLDDFKEDDLISTERQRINWSHPASMELEEWGKKRLQELQIIWKERRAAVRNKKIDEKVYRFAERFENYRPREKKQIEILIRKLATFETLNDQSFEDYGDKILDIWDEGRLHGVIESLKSNPHMPASALAEVLIEAGILSVLNIGEAIVSRIEVLATLCERISTNEYEVELRDFIAENPWLIGVRWEYYKKETGLRHFLDEVAIEVKIEELEGFRGRIDLILTDGNIGKRRFHFVEFMRPGITADKEHLERFMNYYELLFVKLVTNSLLEEPTSNALSGYLIADKLDKTSMLFNKKLELARKENLDAMDWNTLINQVLKQYKEYLELLVESTPEDKRLKRLKERLD